MANHSQGPGKGKSRLAGKPLHQKTYSFSGDREYRNLQRARAAKDAVARAAAPELAAPRRMTWLFIVLAIVMQMVVLGMQMDTVYNRGFDSRYLANLWFSGGVLTLLAVCVGVAVFRRTTPPAAVAVICYAIYLSLAWLVDTETGTMGLLLQGVAMLALLRALWSGVRHDRLARSLLPPSDPLPPKDDPLPPKDDRLPPSDDVAGG